MSREKQEAEPMELLFVVVAHLIGHLISWTFSPVKEEEAEARYYAKHSSDL
jgi:hypothetical protein